jgi:hypothetical protein
LLVYFDLVPGPPAEQRELAAEQAESLSRWRATDSARDERAE